MKNNRTLLQGHFWQININLRFGVPGYLFVTRSQGNNDRFSTTPPHAFSELGKFLGLASTALETCLRPNRVLTGKFGIVSDTPLHFHVLPLHGWILESFENSPEFHCLQSLNPKGYPAQPDAAELIAFVWRAFCHTGNSPISFDQNTVADELEIWLSANLTRFTPA